MRFGLLFAFVSTSVFGGLSAHAAPSASLERAAIVSSTERLRTYPVRTYFTTANEKERIAGSIFFLILETPSKAPIVPVSLRLTYRKGGTTVRIDESLVPLLETIDVTNIPPTRLNPVDAQPPVYWPHAYRLQITLPAALEPDAIDAQLTFDAGTRRRRVSTTIPVAPYAQKTALIFPFKGEGIISVGGALASGHRNRSGLHAIDALGLSPTYGPMLATGHDGDPANYAGWGREIIAPAAGTVVVARNDRIDQPVAEKSDPAYYAPEYPGGGDPGNLVVIDHGNGEFSMIGHLREATVRVKVGDRVTQGQVIGLMGNSGDTTGPHVHYQLQNGPDWERSDGLPVTFTNVNSVSRGSYFEAN